MSGTSCRPRCALALDSATRACSAAVRVDGRLVSHRREERRQGHVERLALLVKEVMEAAGLRFSQLDHVAVTVGPGSFTGLRAGLALARGLALAAGCPTYGVTCFDAVAAAVPPAQRQAGPLLIVIDSRREEKFVQLLPPATATEPCCESFSDPFLDPESERPAPLLLTAEDLAAWLTAPPSPFFLAGASPFFLAGDGAPLVLPVLTSALGNAGFHLVPEALLPDAAWVAALVADRLAVGRTPAPADPYYLRPAEAVRPLHGGRARP